MSVQIYQDSDFKVYKTEDGYIVHNKHKEFKNGHTHVRKYDICMLMIKLVEKKLVPRSRSKYFKESLIRISNDSRYVRKVMTNI